MRRGKDWTMGEVRQLKQLRATHNPIECAHILKRSYCSVRQQLHRQGITIQKHHPKGSLDKEITLLVSKGLVDELIGHKLGITARTVRHHRVRLKLRGNRLGKRRRARCWCCNRLSPCYATELHHHKIGWQTRIIYPAGAPVYEVYCKECFSEYGWPNYEKLNMHTAPDSVGVG